MSTASPAHAGGNRPALDECPPITVSCLGRGDDSQPLQKLLGNEITGITVNFESQGLTQRHAYRLLNRSIHFFFL